MNYMSWTRGASRIHDMPNIKRGEEQKRIDKDKDMTSEGTMPLTEVKTEWTRPLTDVKTECTMPLTGEKT